MSVVNTESVIAEFKEYLAKLHIYKSASSILGFDAHTIAPRGGITARSKRIGFFEQKISQIETSEKMKGFLDKLLPNALELADDVQGMLRICKRKYDKHANVPKEKIGQFSELRLKAQHVWEQARKDNDFAFFAPYLKELVALQKEIMLYRNPDNPSYNLLLDDFEEGITMSTYDSFFDALRKDLVSLLSRVVAAPKQLDRSFLDVPVARANQEEISEFIAKKVGYKLNRGYITASAHPFCQGAGKNDVRITTRYDLLDFASSFYSILHECGHAIYEQNKDDAIADTILDKGTSMGIHESQSRFYENIVGRSFAFWEYISDELKVYLPDSFADITPKQFYEAVNIAKPSLIRVEADELTYSLHIMVRYEIEKMMFMQDIDINELPSIWNKKYKEYLGIDVPNDANGILQDVHWSAGLFGYFPTYAVGSAYSCQILAYMEKEMDVNAAIRSGDFAKITSWLTKHIHRHGSVYDPTTLMDNISKEQLNAEYYIKYLKNKFESLYNL